MKVFKGIRGIISGVFLMVGGSIAVQPFDWGDIHFIGAFIPIILISFAMIMYGVITLPTKEKQG